MHSVNWASNGHMKKHFGEMALGAGDLIDDTNAAGSADSKSLFN